MNRLITLERLANGVIRSMTHLEKLSLWECNLTLTEDVLQLFRSCPKITELRISLFDPKRVERQRVNEMNEDAKNELRSGFQRLVKLDWTVYSCPVIQEIFTWLKECVHLTVSNYHDPPELDASLTLSPDFVQNLRFLDLYKFPVELVKWILPFCPNIHTLKIDLIDQPNDLHNDIIRLKKLKVLDIATSKGIDPKEVTCVAFRNKTTLLTSSQIIRNCRQLEVLRFDSSFTLRDLPELEHYKNLKAVHLRCLTCPSVKDGLLIVLKRCTHLHRLTLEILTDLFDSPESVTLEELCDFIMKMKHLTLLHITCHDHSRFELIKLSRRTEYENCLHFKSEVDQVKAFVLPRRPNFKFYLSCCYYFDKP